MTPLYFAVFAFTISAVVGVKYGFDVPSTTVISTDAVKCFQNKDVHNEDNISYEFINIRVGDSNGVIQNGLDTWKNAGGHIDAIDCSIEICPKKDKDIYVTVDKIAKQVSPIPNVFVSALVYGENDDCWYTSGSADDVQKNIDGLQDAWNSLTNREKTTIGIKTNKQNWTKLTGDSTGFSSGNWLWWASEGSASFDGFESFGGWKDALLREYQVGAKKCNVTANLNVGKDDYELCRATSQSCKTKSGSSDPFGDCCPQNVCIDGTCVRNCSELGKALNLPGCN